MTKWRMAAAGAAAVLMLAGAACSGGDGGAKVATINDGDGSDSSSSGSGGEEMTNEDFQDALLEHAQCMRDHGIDMPDPTFDGSGKGGMVIARDAVDIDSPQFKDAEEACAHIMEDVRQNMPKPSPEEEAEMRDNMLEFAQCMRDHGIDMPDPTFDGEGRVKIEVGGPPPESSDGATSSDQPSAPDAGQTPRMDPEFEAAMEACGDKSPMGGRFDSSDSSGSSDSSDG